MFSIFAQLWILAFFVHHSEDWDPISITALGMLLVVWVNLAKDRALPFLASIVFFTAYNLYKAPYLANHTNFFLLVCSFLSIWAAISWIRNGQLTEAKLNEEFLGLRPALCLSLFVVYFMAGFHKLNVDFFDPEVSCASDFFLRYSWEYGFPASWIPQFLLDWSPYVVVVVELGGAILLLIPRLQILGLLCFLGLHSYLVPLSFYDFANICYAILLCFLPARLFQGEANRARIQKGVSFLISCMLAGSVVARIMIDYELDAIEADVAQGWFFLVGSFHLVYQLHSNMRSEGLQPWTLPGLHLFAWRSVDPRWMLAMPVLLLVFTNTSYLGLRTAGNTSMFSNLRTEGGRSNHLLISSAWQPFGFQKEVVYVEDLPDRLREYRRDQPDLGMGTTAFELRRFVETWREEDREVPMVLEYQGEQHTYEDITQAEEWSEPLPWLAKKLMLFRVIQPDGANECRW